MGRTDLTGANFNGADLGGATLEGATCNATVFAGVNLAEARGLASVEHRGPSSVGVDTLALSRGNIPEAFLRGCGVPQSIIENGATLLGRTTVQRPTNLFVRFSRGDAEKEFAKLLGDRLREAGMRAWLVPQDIELERTIARLRAQLARLGHHSQSPTHTARRRSPVGEQLPNLLRRDGALVLVLSEESMASEWVARDVSSAREREQVEGRKLFFPIRLVEFNALQEWECFDVEAGKDLAPEVRALHIPDFANWKDRHAFEAAFTRLLDGLRASAGVAMTAPK